MKQNVMVWSIPIRTISELNNFKFEPYSFHLPPTTKTLQKKGIPSTAQENVIKMSV